MTGPEPSRPTWRRSTHSGGNGGSCVEVATVTGAPGRAVAVRDSKDPGGPVLVFEPRAWSRFLTGLARQPVTGNA